MTGSSGVTFMRKWSKVPRPDAEDSARLFAKSMKSLIVGVVRLGRSSSIGKLVEVEARTSITIIKRSGHMGHAGKEGRPHAPSSAKVHLCWRG